MSRQSRPCKKCKAPILLLQTVKGRWMPVDAKPQKRVIIEYGKAVVIDTYTPHWGTCPHAATFRRKGAK